MSKYQEGFCVQNGIKNDPSNRPNPGSIRLVDLSDNTSIIDVDISKARTAEPLPIGLIIMFKGDFNNLPRDWAFCDGNNGTPNLRNRFILGTNTITDNRAGGQKESTLSKHTHTVSKTNDVDGHTHNVDYALKWGSNESGDHHHGASKAGDERIHLATVGYTDQWFNWGSDHFITSKNGAHNHDVTIPKTDSDDTAAHTHVVSISESTGGKDDGNLPPYYSLAYIMKVK